MKCISKYLTSVANTWSEPTESTHFFSFPQIGMIFQWGKKQSYRPLPIEANESQQLLRDYRLGKFDLSAEKLLERNLYSTRPTL